MQLNFSPQVAMFPNHSRKKRFYSLSSSIYLNGLWYLWPTMFSFIRSWLILLHHDNFSGINLTLGYLLFIPCYTLLSVTSRLGESLPSPNQVQWRLWSHQYHIYLQNRFWLRLPSILLSFLYSLFWSYLFLLWAILWFICRILCTFL